MDTPVETTADLIPRFRSGAYDDLPDGWWTWPQTVEAHQVLQRDFLSHVPTQPPMHGRGIVVCTGGDRYFTSAYVCARMLRHLGCRLPIQFWHRRNEMDTRMKELVAEIGVAPIRVEDVLSRLECPPRVTHGWALKPLALLHSPFREVLLLDADNVPVRDPTYMFDDEVFRRVGAVFWPDFGRLAPARPIWQICEVEYRDEPEFESGQILVDKARCWKPLQLAMHYNEHWEFYYRHIHGDKDTYHMAFRRLDCEYGMPARGIHRLPKTMCQHDLAGHRLFQHRNMDKWRIDGGNLAIDDFWFEDVCRYFISELRGIWPGSVDWLDVLDANEQAAYQALAGRTLRYTRVGHDSRDLELLRDGTIGLGGARCERRWRVSSMNGDVMLTIYGDRTPTCHLHRDGGTWRGQWLIHERMPVELTAPDAG